MPELKTKSVAILYNKDNTCKYVCLAAHISEKEYKELVNQMVDNEQKEIAKKIELETKVSELETIVETLKHEIKVLKGEDEDEQN